MIEIIGLHITDKLYGVTNEIVFLKWQDGGPEKDNIMLAKSVFLGNQTKIALLYIEKKALLIIFHFG
jgi:hypothetical protein